MRAELDDYNIKLLSILSRDGRITWSNLASRIGLSLTPTLKRVRALEASGYIAGYHATIDETLVGRGISVFVSVRLSTQTDEALGLFEKEIRQIPEIMSCFMLTGEIDYMLRAVVPDMPGYQNFISVLTRIPGVAQVSTGFEVKRVIQLNTPPLPLPKRPALKPRPPET